MPLYRKSKLPCGSTLTIWKIEEEEDELRALLSLNFQEVMELSTVKYPESRKRWMASRLALKSVFDDWRVLEIQKDCHGKPYFELEEGYFSLSHSGDFAVCIYHPTEKMGIDIEFIRDKVLAIQHKFMKPGELAWLDEKEKVESLYVAWCVKEAVYKWRGKKGLSMKDGITLQAFTYSEQGTVQALLKNGNEEEQLSLAFERIEGYMMAYVLTN